MEIWKDIKGYENIYQVSNTGKIKRIEKNKELKQAPNKRNGYLYIHLSGNGVNKVIRVHKLVAETFIPNPENKPQVNHIDGDKTNNRVENLEWVTNGENQIHAFKNNLQKGNFEHPNSKLTLEQVLYIKNNCIVGSKIYGIQTLAKKFNVCNSTIKQIIQGKSYKYVNKTNSIGKT